MFLHVITYNDAAIKLYSRHGFQCVARLPNFYFIGTGRQPDPQKSVYDSFLYVQFVPLAAHEAAAMACDASHAWTPLRSAWGHIQRATCAPMFWQRCGARMGDGWWGGGGG